METRPGISMLARPIFPDSLAWNEDGQIAVSLETSVHILTPILVGDSSEEDSCIHVGIAPVDPDGKDHDFGESAVLNKPVQSSYSIPEAYRCAVWSPSGLSSTFGSFLTIITTKHRVLLYSSPESNDTKQDWQACMDLTPKIKENVLGSDTNFDNLDQINRFHSIICAWSPRIIADPLAEQPAILSLSNKAGEVNFWSYSQDDFQHMITIQPHKSFVNLLRWTGWQIQNDEHTSYIFSTCTDGTVCLSSITVRVIINKNRRASVELLGIKCLDTWFTNDHAIPTTINVWEDLKRSQIIKVILCKGIIVQTATIHVNKDAQIQGDWKNYRLENSSMGLSGACWAPDGMLVKTYTHEGECVVLNVGETETTKDDALSKTVNLKLSGKYQQQWMEEKAKMEDDELAPSMMPQIWGAADSRNGIYTALVFSMKPLISVFNRAEACDDTWVAFLMQSERDNNDTQNFLCRAIDQYVRDRDFLFTCSMKGILGELLEFLFDVEESTLIHAWLSTLDGIMSNPEEQPIKSSSLTRRVYSDPSATAARILMYIDIALKYFELPGNVKTTITTLLPKAKQYINQHYLQAVLGFILDKPNPEFKKYSDDDIMVILLACDQALLQLTPAKSLILSAKSVLERVEQVFPKSPVCVDLKRDIETATALLEDRQPPEHEEATRRERCPACDDHIIPSSAPMVACPQGHFWDKCSMTMRVMPIPNVRKCSTCGAKSLQPGSLDMQGGNKKTHVSLTDEILSQCWKCAVCGSNLLDVHVV